jgi:hypothetical protein
MREGARMASFEDEMSMEFRLASRVALLPDFAEGVRACLIDKDQAPRWNPPTLEDVGEDCCGRCSPGCRPMWSGRPRPRRAIGGGAGSGERS